MSKILITAAAMLMVLSVPSAPSFAMGGNIAGTNFPGEPINSSVKSSARKAGGGHTPGYYASRGYSSRAYVAVPARKKMKVRRY
jgi:hypothetical protein